jgi:hypothetical protein
MAGEAEAGWNGGAALIARGRQMDPILWRFAPRPFKFRKTDQLRSVLLSSYS